MASTLEILFSPERRATTVWSIAAIALVLALAGFFLIFLSTVRFSEEEAVAAGKQVVINLKTGEIKIKEGNQEKPKPPEEKKEPPPMTGSSSGLEPSASSSSWEAGGSSSGEIISSSGEVASSSGEIISGSSSSSSGELSTAPAPMASQKQPPRIAIIITGLGLSQSSTEEAMQLPAAVTFSFSPYGANLKGWVGKAQESGHVVLVDLPLEPADYPASDPGPYALLTSLPDTQNLERLGTLTALVPGINGLVTEPTEKFTLAPTGANSLLPALKERNLMLVYGNITHNRALTDKAREVGANFLTADHWIDKDLSTEAVDARLADILEIAKREGHAVAMGRPYPLTIQRLKQWLPKLAAEQIELVPVTAIHSASQ